MSSTHNLVPRATETCVDAKPDDRGHVPPGACNSFYPYDPSTALALVTAIIFLVVTLVHLFFAFRYKAGYCGIIIVGASWELFAFGLRTYGTRNQQKKNSAVISFLLFTLAPIWINAFVYMVAGRLITMFSPTKRIFKVSSTMMSRMFILFDILAFIVQLGGGMMISPGASAERVKLGLRVYQGGLGLQQFFIVAFVVILIGFHLEMIGLEKTGWSDSHNRKWKLLLYIEYIALLLITGRVIFRLIEYILPHENNPLITNEIYLYVLDALPMALCLVIYIVYHPGRVLKGPGSDFRLAKKQIKADKKASKQAKKMGFKNVDGSDDEEERMIGVELQNHNHGGPAAYGPPTAYGGPSHGDLGGQQPLYDPYHGNARM